MPHITLPEGEAGIVSLMLAYPETQRPINDMCNAIMCGPSSLTTAERELIATYVSHGNQCHYCTSSHAAAARELLGENAPLLDRVLADLDTSGLDDKMKALLVIAGKTRVDGRHVTADDVARARVAGADDKAIHDTVLITAMFCMFNRYVEGLGTHAPPDLEFYKASGKRIATLGYGSRFRTM